MIKENIYNKFFFFWIWGYMHYVLPMLLYETSFYIGKYNSKYNSKIWNTKSYKHTTEAEAKNT